VAHAVGALGFVAGNAPLRAAQPRRRHPPAATSSPPTRSWAPGRRPVACQFHTVPPSHTVLDSFTGGLPWPASIRPMTLVASGICECRGLRPRVLVARFTASDRASSLPSSTRSAPRLARQRPVSASRNRRASPLPHCRALRGGKVPGVADQSRSTLPSGAGRPQPLQSPVELRLLSDIIVSVCACGRGAPVMILASLAATG